MARFVTALSATIIACVSAMPPTVAADYKAYPGSICQAQLGHQDRDIKRHASRGIGNYSDEFRTIVCPIIKDAIDQYEFGLEAWIYFTTPNSIVCYLMAADPYGNQMDQDYAYSFGGHNLHLRTYAGHAYGVWGLSCWMGPGTVLHSYLVHEKATE